MIESFVDLTYRGLSLGRRIKLTQIRPSSGYLELPAPMPVGTHLTIATDDGVVLDATVTWVYEQVAGSEQTPGVLVAPALAAEPAAAWWKARVALPDEERPRTRTTRNRPLTIRPRTPTVETPAPAASPEPGLSAILSDLTARVAAAAGVAPPEPPRPPEPAEPPSAVDEDAGSRTVVTRAVAQDDERRTTVMNAVDQELLEQLSRPEGEVVLRGTEDHAVIDDGNRTTIMDSIDPAALGLDLTATTELDLGADPGGDDDDVEAGDPPAGDAKVTLDAADSRDDKPPAGGRFKKRRKRR